MTALPAPSPARPGTPDAAPERRWRNLQQTLARLRKRRPRAGTLLYRLYVVLIFTLPLLLVAANAIRTAEPLRPDAAARLWEQVTVAAPLLVLAGVALALRTLAWHGVVVMPRSDIEWLLSAPVPRALILRPLLVRVVTAFAAVGGLVGLAAGSALVLAVGVPASGFATVGVVATLMGAAVGALLACVGWVAQCYRPLARALLRAGPPLAIASGASAVVGWMGLLPGSAALVATWSGPWGWALVPLWVVADASSAAAGLPVPSARGPAATAVVAAAMALVVLALAAAAWLANRRMRKVPLEEMRRREATSARLLTSAVYAADFRGAAQARREAVIELTGRRPASRRWPAHKRLAVPWTGAILLLRARERIFQAGAWAAAAVGAAIWATGAGLEVGGPVLAVMLAYPAAGLLNEPLRTELEQRFLSRSVPPSLGSLLRQLASTSTFVLALLGVLAVLVVTRLPAWEATPAPLALVLVGLLMAPLLTACAAVISTGPEPQAGWLFMGDIGIGMLMMYVTRGPQLAAAVAGVPATLGQFALAAGAHPALVAVAAGLWIPAALAGLDAWSRHRLEKFH